MRPMRAFILAAALLPIAAPAEASICLLIANRAAQIADQRDDGIPENRSMGAREISESTRVGNDRLLRVFRKMNADIYADWRITRERAYRMSWANCGWPGVHPLIGAAR